MGPAEPVRTPAHPPAFSLLTSEVEDQRSVETLYLGSSREREAKLEAVPASCEKLTMKLCFVALWSEAALEGAIVL